MVLIINNHNFCLIGIAKIITRFGFCVTPSLKPLGAIDCCDTLGGFRGPLMSPPPPVLRRSANLLYQT